LIHKLFCAEVAALLRLPQVFCIPAAAPWRSGAAVAQIRQPFVMAAVRHRSRL